MASFLVTRSTYCLVTPSEPTPTVTLDLSVLDKFPVLRVYVRTLHVFRHGPEAARVIKEALSKALVPYYPLAGRLKESSQDQLQVQCSGQGVWFLEASADCTLEDVNYFVNTLTLPDEDLLPDSIPEVEGMEPLVQLQVTQFACGGFTIGLRFCHCICDGLGAAQFFQAVGELARGLQRPTITPVWQRDFLPPALLQGNTSLPSLPIPNYTLAPAHVDIPIDRMDRIKRDFQETTGQTCSTFDVVAALFWKYRTIAIELKQDTKVRLCFYAGFRQLADPPLPEGFYGNAFFLQTITASSESLALTSDIDVIKLIQNGKAKLPEEFAKYVKGEHLKDGNDNPFAPPPTFTTLHLSEWGRLGFNRVDYGWGRPVYVVPIQGSDVVPAGIICSLPLPQKGIRLITWSVEEAQREPFVDLMTKAL